MAKSKIKFLLAAIITTASLVLLAASSFAVTIGDVDTNGEIKAADARLALRAAVKLETLTKEQFTAADVDCSGDIKASDARSILRASVGLEKLNREHKFSEWKTERSANCLKPGIKTRSCPCGETEIQELPTTKHSWSKWTVVTQATQQKEGSEERICNNCHSVEKRKLEKLPTAEEPEQCKHSFGDWVIKTQPTCTKTGTKSRTCDCGEVQTEAIPATGKHTYGKWVVTTQPTCDSTGIKSRTCTCGKIESELIPATGKHTIKKTSTVDATCSGKDGYYKWQCSVCKKTGTTVIPGGHSYKLEHATVNQSKVCSRCGFVEEKSFNEYVNSIKQERHLLSYLDIKENSSKTTAEKLKFSQTLSMLLLMQGSSVAQLKKELTGEMNYTEKIFGTFYRQRTLNTNNFPLSGKEAVSELEDSDVLSYTIEKVDKVDFTKTLPDSYTSRYDIVYNMTDYNEREIDNLIKLTVVLKPEKYSEIKNSDKPTALMKATDNDLKALVSQAENIDSNDDMGQYASINCKEATSDVTITYYIDATNDAPVAALYETKIVFDTKISMNMMEMLTGYIDFTTTSKTSSLYFFDDYFTQ